MITKIVKKYRPDFIGSLKRKAAEKELFRHDYVIGEERQAREWRAGHAIFWLIVFFPLIFLAYVKVTEVTYIKEM